MRIETSNYRALLDFSRLYPELWKLFSLGNCYFEIRLLIITRRDGGESRVRFCSKTSLSCSFPVVNIKENSGPYKFQFHTRISLFVFLSPYAIIAGNLYVLVLPVVNACLCGRYSPIRRRCNLRYIHAHKNA